jgi:hypothetical protein
VGDIEAVQKNARLKRIAMQVRKVVEPMYLFKLSYKMGVNFQPYRCSGRIFDTFVLIKTLITDMLAFG